MDDLTISIAIYHLFFFAEGIMNGYGRSKMGQSLIGFMLINFSFRVGIAII
jgi:hypothetical protein